jgi:hypothetical protein
VNGPILKPSGKPFDSAGTEEALAAAGLLERSACISANTTHVDPTPECDAAAMLRNVVYDRDHLHHQVTEAQTTATAERDKRMWAVARLRGAMARVLNHCTGKANPYLPDMDQRMWLAWEEGWDEAEVNTTRAMEATVYRARYEGALAATQGINARCPYPKGCVAADHWEHGYNQASDNLRPMRAVGA